MSDQRIDMAVRLLRKRGGNVNMIAVCFRGSCVISWGCNDKKTIPMPVNSYRYELSDGRPSTCSRHAELNAIRKVKSIIDTIVIVRLTKNGDVSKSMPCSMCRKIIAKQKIKTIIYTDWCGGVITERVLSP
jgi:deoxycytidylate deaminase